MDEVSGQSGQHWQMESKAAAYQFRGSHTLVGVSCLATPHKLRIARIGGTRETGRRGLKEGNKVRRGGYFVHYSTLARADGAKVHDAMYTTNGLLPLCYTNPPGETFFLLQSSSIEVGFFFFFSSSFLGLFLFGVVLPLHLGQSVIININSHLLRDQLTISFCSTTGPKGVALFLTMGSIQIQH